MFKLLLFTTLFFAANSVTKWEPDFATALSKAKTDHKFVLLNFSGSDWCGPCIRMHKTILDNEVFLQNTDSLLYMVNADFPRAKKNSLAKNVAAQNELLAEQYNKDGNFPFTVLLNEDGKVLKTWNGCPDETPAAFAAEIQKVYAVLHAK